MRDRIAQPRSTKEFYIYIFFNENNILKKNEPFQKNTDERYIILYVLIYIHKSYVDYVNDITN